MELVTCSSHSCATIFKLESTEIMQENWLRARRTQMVQATAAVVVVPRLLWVSVSEYRTNVEYIGTDDIVVLSRKYNLFNSLTVRHTDLSGMSQLV